MARKRKGNNGTRPNDNDNNEAPAKRRATCSPDEINVKSACASEELTAQQDSSLHEATIDSKQEIPVAEQDMDTDEDHEDENGDDDDDDDDEEGWENVEIPEQPTETTETTETTVYSPVEVVLKTPRAVLRKSVWDTQYDRLLREIIHNCHVVLLIAHAMTRNIWCSREDVMSVGLSVVPAHIQQQCQRKEEADKEFSTGLKWLLAWWKEYFTLTGPGLLTTPYNKCRPPANASRVHGDETPHHLATRFTTKTGDRDTSAQLFVSLARALGFETRLVNSIQPVPYRIPAKRTEEHNTSSADLDQPTSSQAKLRFPAVTPRPRLTPKEDSVDEELKHKSAKPPTMWAEVYNPHQDKWICLDPIRGFYDKPRHMEPSLSDSENVMSLVLAFPPNYDGCLDVTRRYTTQMDRAYRHRERMLTKREKQAGMTSWWEGFYQHIHTQWDERTEHELVEMEKEAAKEPMPTSIKGFQNHALYALERHLKKFQVLHPKEPVLGQIRGEKIYPRSCVKEVHTRETWLKLGRVVKEDEEPAKQVNARAVTIEKKRAQEIAREQGESLVVDCFGEWQTEPYKPQAVVDGIVPKNSYGRVDLFTPEMLPQGAVHIPISGIGKVARRLGIDYAEATVDFEFTRGRSVPVSNGIVIAKEHEFVLMEAWKEHEDAQTNRAIETQEKKVLAKWRRLIQSVLIQARLDHEYGSESSKQESHWETQLRTRHERDMQETAGGGFVEEELGDTQGGFLEE